MNRHTMQAAVLCSSLVFLGVGIVGCETSEPGVTNTVGRYDKVIDAPPTRVTKATEAVLKDDYKFKIESSASTAIDGKVVARTAQNVMVTVWVEREGTEMSKVSVRVDEVGGNESLSLEILNKIKDKSKTVMEKIQDKL